MIAGIDVTRLTPDPWVERTIEIVDNCPDLLKFASMVRRAIAEPHFGARFRVRELENLNCE